MQIPNSQQAYVPPEKLLDYLLSESHPVGRDKARWLARAGYSKANWKKLETDLLQIATSEHVAHESVSVHGTKYIIDGSIGITTREPQAVRTVWIIDKGSTSPRFITLYPVR